MNAIPPRNTPNRPTHLSGIRTLAANVAVPLLFGLGTAATALAAPPGADRYIIKFQPGMAAQARAAVAAARGNVVLEMPDARRRGRGAARCRAWPGSTRNPPDVEYIEPDVLRFPMALASPSTGTPYALGQLVPFGIPMVQADQLAAADAGSRKVCIIDSGYDLGHPDLASSLDVTGEFDSGTGWWYTDENHHGTHVAGTISAINNGLGVVGVVSNQKLKLHIVKVFDAAGWAYSSTLTDAVTKCVNAGANVISMSLGGSFSRGRTEKSAFDKYYAAPYQVLSIAARAATAATPRLVPGRLRQRGVESRRRRHEHSRLLAAKYNKDVEIGAPRRRSPLHRSAGAGRDVVALRWRHGACLVADGRLAGRDRLSSAALVDCGLGTASCAGANGKVCPCSGHNTLRRRFACQNGVGSAR